jgi:NhaA family Na+:H+ antiporter
MIKLSLTVKNFLKTENSGGLIMIGFALLALLVANSSLSSEYFKLVNYSQDINFFNTNYKFSLHFFINDILMVIFFLLVALELKNEFKHGFLAEKSQIALPLACAFMGMAAPALIYFLTNYPNQENIKGWAIPSATDIAFAVAILSIISKKIPPSAKIFLLALAIFDDIGAIIIIALFYSSGLDYNYLILSFLLIFSFISNFICLKLFPYFSSTTENNLKAYHCFYLLYVSTLEV